MCGISGDTAWVSGAEVAAPRSPAPPPSPPPTPPSPPRPPLSPGYERYGDPKIGCLSDEVCWPLRAGSARGRSTGVRGACVARAWRVRGACVACAQRVRGACVARGQRVRGAYVLRTRKPQSLPRGHTASQPRVHPFSRHHAASHRDPPKAGAPAAALPPVPSPDAWSFCGPLTDSNPFRGNAPSNGRAVLLPKVSPSH